MSDTTESPPRSTTGRTLRLHPRTHRALQRRAFRDRRRMSEIARDALVAYYGQPIPDSVPPSSGVTKGSGLTLRLSPTEKVMLQRRARVEQRREADVLRSAMEAYVG